MIVDFETIQTVATDYFIQIGNGVLFIGHKIVDLTQEGFTYAKPYVQLLSEKIQEAWIALLPVLEGLFEFAKSNLGIASILLVSAIICMQAASSQSDSGNKIAAVAYFSLGLGCAVASGAFLMCSGYISKSGSGIPFAPNGILA